MTITNSSTKCNKLRGTVPESGVSLCRIYMTKSNSKADCSQFIDHMKAMNDDPNSAVQFTVTSISHHKQRPMIKAKLNADAVNKVSACTISVLCKQAYIYMYMNVRMDIYTLQFIILSFSLRRFVNHKKLNPSEC